MSNVEAISTPNQKSTRSKCMSSTVTETSKNHSVSGKRGVSTPRELFEPNNDEELLAGMEDESVSDVGQSSQNSATIQDDGVEVSHAPLVGQNTLIRLGYTHPKLEPDNVTGIRVELVIQERLKHISFNDLKQFLNQMGQNFFCPPDNKSPVLCKEINGYPIPKSDKICMFGKVMCKPDFLFLKRLFLKAAEGSNLVLCPETFASDELSIQLATPYFIRGVSIFALLFSRSQMSPFLTLSHGCR